MEDQYTITKEENTAREDMNYFLSTCKFNWPTLIEMIHNKIQELNLTTVTPITYDKGWERIFIGTGGKRKNVFWWKEFCSITKAIQVDIGKRGENKEVTLHEILKRRSQPIEDKLCYGYFINQDTIIPKFFESSYKQRLPNIEFIQFEDWNEGLEAFAGNKVHVALRDFPTTVAYNSMLDIDSPLFFWPFFSFYGYGIFIRVAALKKFFKTKGIDKQSFKQLEKSQRIEFLESCTYIVERNTDFEWVLKNFCASEGCDLQKIQEKITYMNTRLGKLEFLNKKDHDIYCTNPAHIIDLDGRKEFELIPQNTNIRHKNFNGLICKEKFYIENKKVVERLIKTWFADIVPFKNEIKILSHPPAHRPENYTPSYTVRNLTNELSHETNSQITIDDLPILYEHSNHFYDDPTVAFDEFYNKVLSNKIAIRNYAEIALIQLDRRTNGIDKVEQVIRAIKDNMIKL